MSSIHIIAGPPGIGKSTRGPDYINPNLDILNEDDMRLKYKEKGFIDYNEYSIFRVRDIIKQKLIRDEDFALELNLGFPHQYEYAVVFGQGKSPARKRFAFSKTGYYRPNVPKHHSSI